MKSGVMAVTKMLLPTTAALAVVIEKARRAAEAPPGSAPGVERASRERRQGTGRPCFGRSIFATIRNVLGPFAFTASSVHAGAA